MPFFRDKDLLNLNGTSNVHDVTSLTFKFNEIQKLTLRVGTGRFGQVLPKFYTWPEPIRFGKILPAIRIKVTISARFQVWRGNVGFLFFLVFFFLCWRGEGRKWCQSRSGSWIWGFCLRWPGNVTCTPDRRTRCHLSPAPSRCRCSRRRSRSRSSSTTRPLEIWGSCFGSISKVQFPSRWRIDLRGVRETSEREREREEREEAAKRKEHRSRFFFFFNFLLYWGVFGRVPAAKKNHTQNPTRHARVGRNPTRICNKKKHLYPADRGGVERVFAHPKLTWCTLLDTINFI